MSSSTYPVHLSPLMFVASHLKCQSTHSVWKEDHYMLSGASRALTAMPSAPVAPITRTRLAGCIQRIDNVDDCANADGKNECHNKRSGVECAETCGII
jgi:hypothetical protein